jgi:CRP-like cAMP-binding protein
MKVAGVFRSATETKTLPAGAIIFKEGDAGEEMFGVIEGQVELSTASGHVFQVGPDEVFGEMALVDSSKRSATAAAATEVSLAVIDRRRFLFLIHETPMFALQVMSTLAERLRDAREGR